MNQIRAFEKGLYKYLDFGAVRQLLEDDRDQEGAGRSTIKADMNQSLERTYQGTVPCTEREAGKRGSSEA